MVHNETLITNRGAHLCKETISETPDTKVISADCGGGGGVDGGGGCNGSYDDGGVDGGGGDDDTKTCNTSLSYGNMIDVEKETNL